MSDVDGGRPWWARQRPSRSIWGPQPDPGRGRSARRPARRRRYDIEVDLTDLPTGHGRPLRLHDHLHLPRAGRRAPSSTARPRSSPPRSTASTCRPRRGRPHRARRPRGATTSSCGERAADTTDGEGVHRAVDPADGEVYVWTSFEPDEARHVWACFDQPDLKAPHAFTVTAPAAWTVVSNSGDPVVEEAEPRRPPARGGPSPTRRRCRRTTRSSTPGRSTRSAARPTATTSACSPASRWPPILDRDADELFTLTGQGLAFFGEVFGMPFPQRKYDQVFLPEFGGAMENYGCVTWSDAFLRRVTPTPAERELLAKVLLHEMAHMWFGNIVTMRWWDDLWLNEAFAEFACNWAPVRATAYTDAWAAHLAGGKLHGLPRRPGPDLAPDPPADPRRRGGRVDLRRHHLPQGRLGPAAADALRRRGRRSRPAWRRTSPGTPGATPRCRT